jgi:hypothetical protein
MIAPPYYDGTRSTTSWTDSNSGNYTVTYTNDLEPAPEAFNVRHVPMREQGIPEVPWCEVIPPLPILAREVAKHVGKQRRWTGRNFRKAS